MLILGHNTEEIGNQLERVASDILGELGYVHIVRNRIGSGGEEIDLSADFLMPMPAGDRLLRVIAECKAHRNPVGMPDWLKFLGKVFVEDSATNNQVSGLFIALSGVNGNVSGSYEELRRSKDRLRLFSGDELSETVCKLHSAIPAKEIAGRISRFTRRAYLAVEIAYYNREVYWLVEFGDANYTILSAKGEPLTGMRTGAIREMIEQRTVNRHFLDLLAERQAIIRELQLQQRILGALMIANRPMDAKAVLMEVNGYLPPPSEGEKSPVGLGGIAGNFGMEELDKSIESLKTIGWVIPQEGKYQILQHDAVDYLKVLASMLRFIFQGYVPQMMLENLMTSSYLEAVINEKLVHHVEEVQRHLKITEKDAALLLRIVRLSPAALVHCLNPDPMLVNHRSQEPASDAKNDEFDVEMLMLRLFDKLIEDFRTPAMLRYFYKLRNLREIATRRTITLKGGSGVVIEREINHRLAAMQLPTKHGGGYCHMTVPTDAIEPWELGDSYEVEIFPPTT